MKLLSIILRDVLKAHVGSENDKKERDAALKYHTEYLDKNKSLEQDLRQDKDRIDHLTASIDGLGVVEKKAETVERLDESQNNASQIVDKVTTAESERIGSLLTKLTAGSKWPSNV